MTTLYPFTFRPIFKERVWGGRNLERLYHKPLPPGPPIGESWEISDRPGDVSVIANGPLAGQDLRWLMERHEPELLGPVKPLNGRFPLLCKILDAQDKLSLQVHPPPAVAAQLKGEPKTEMWYIADATPEADLYVGLKRGVTRAEFKKRVADGSVATCFHRVPVKAGDAMFLPSGRVHAIGAGNVLFEIQQNSDTTYRVYDWGRPRELHLAQSLASINFADFEPRLLQTQYSRNEVIKTRYLVEDPLFTVNACQVKRGQRFYLRNDAPTILALLRGRLIVIYEGQELRVGAGGFVLLPAVLGRVTLTAETQVEFLQAQPGR